MISRVFWSLSDQTSTDRPDQFLSEAEQTIFEKFRFDLRRSSFLAGRWVAKGLIQKALSLENAFSEIAILNESSGKPYAVIDGERLEGELSISHAGKWAAAVLSLDGVQVGVDVELIAPRPKSFVADYFTSSEIELLKSHPGNDDRDVTLIWSAKEAVLKALGLGLRLDTRRVIVTSLEDPLEGRLDGWNKLSLESVEKGWFGYWRQVEDAVLVCAVDSSGGKNINLIKV